MMHRIANVVGHLAPTTTARLSNVAVRSMSTAASAPKRDAFLTHIQSELESIRAAGTYKNERVITSQQSNLIRVQETSQPVLNFCANNYLGLANNAELIAASKAALDSHGLGLASVRFICGTQNIHKQLEKKIAAFHGMDDAILFPSCFDANAGLFESLLGPEDAVISDSLNHASIIDGIRLCKAKRLRYQHLDMNDLEKQLQEAQSSRFRLIATDGVFSMDGDIAPLQQICALAEKYNAYVFIDEAHSTGFLGSSGRGTIEHTGVTGRVQIINSTLGKALGGATGGYTTGPQPIIDLLRQRARPYLFSNTIPPAVAAAGIATFDMLTKSTALRDKLAKNTRTFRDRMGQAGFKLAGDKDCPICPVMLGDARLASQFADEMLQRGVYVIGFSFPVVPKGQARIRVQVSAAHSEADIERCVNAFVEVRQKLMPKA